MSTPGVSFSGVHSASWGLILTGQEIGLPAVKTVTVDLPGADGVLDLTEALTGAPCYGNRTLTLTFTTLDKLTGTSWASLLTTVASALHGQTKDIVFDDDPNWYYTGRCFIDSFATSGALRSLVIRCDCEPYKHSTANSAMTSL